MNEAELSETVRLCYIVRSAKVVLWKSKGNGKTGDYIGMSVIAVLKYNSGGTPTNLVGDNGTLGHEGFRSCAEAGNVLVAWPC